MWGIYDNIKYLYGVNAYNKDNLKAFVGSGTITKDQYKEITDEEYLEPQA
ncbi:XkdX family protein [Staphylococcus equorum]